jgi:hypothetical protein
MLAWACDHAGCTAAQAGALLLLAQGRTIRQIARELGLTYAQSRAALDNGRERLERAFQHLVHERLHWLKSLLQCLRNHRDCRPAPILTYAPIGNGGYDSTPVTVRARPHGSVPEDFLDDPRDLLHALCEALA